ncbi:MAG: TAXI family TRAP transporter solute-binding subunit, partial [Candidatus Hydrogenedentota bacterium]
MQRAQTSSISRAGSWTLLALVLLPGLVVMIVPGAIQTRLAGELRGDAAPRPLVIAAGPNALPLASALAGDGADISVRAQPSPGDAVQELEKGNAQAALLPATHAAASPDLAAVANLGYWPVQMVVATGGPIGGFADLAGRRIGVGLGAPASGRVLEAVLARFPFQAAPDPVTDHSRNLEKAFLEGEIDALLAVASYGAPALQALLDTGWYTLLPLPRAALLAQQVPGGAPLTIPAGIYTPTWDGDPLPPEPLAAMGVPALLAVKRNASAGTVYRLHGLAEAPAWRTITPLLAPASDPHSTAPLPLHPAARRARAPEDPRDRFETALIFLLGLGYVCVVLYFAAGRAETRMRRQQAAAFALHCKTLLDGVHRIETTSDPDALPHLMDIVAAARRQAEQDWEAGRIDAHGLARLFALYEAGGWTAAQRLLRCYFYELQAQGDALLGAVQRGEAAPAVMDEEPRAPEPEVPDEAPEPTREEDRYRGIPSEAAAPFRAADEPHEDAACAREDAQEAEAETAANSEDGGLPEDVNTTRAVAPRSYDAESEPADSPAEGILGPPIARSQRQSAPESEVESELETPVEPGPVPEPGTGSEPEPEPEP